MQIDRIYRISPVADTALYCLRETRQNASLTYFAGCFTKKSLHPAQTGRRLLRYTTYYCILLYEFLLTWEIRPSLLACLILTSLCKNTAPSVQPGSSGVIFRLSLLTPGFHHPRLSFAFRTLTLSISAFIYYII